MSSATAKNFHIASLDGIRAVAAIIVFVSHAGLQGLVPGVFGVTVFFFLSGYLITTLLRTEYEQAGKISLKKFYRRRIYRIFPPLYLVLIIVLLVSFLDGTAFNITLGAVAAQFAHLTNYYMIFFGGAHVVPETGVMWSLAVEEHFYLLFPLILLTLLKRFDYRRIGICLLILCACVLLWRCYLVFGRGVESVYINLATDTRFDSLLFGCIMGIWLNPALDRHFQQVDRWTWILVLAVAVGLLLFSFLYRDEQFRATFRYSVQGLALLPIFFCAVRLSHWPIFRWLDFAWMRYLGLISYTFYLVHTKVIDLADRYVPTDNNLVQALAAFAMTVAFASAMYFLVEKRFAALRRKLHT